MRDNIVNVSINSVFSLEVIDYMQQLIEDANGVELLFIGKIDSEGVVEIADVVAKGGLSSVSVIPREAEEGDVIIHNHPNNILIPSEADISVASILGERGIGFYIIDNSVTNVSVVVKPINIYHKKKITVTDLSNIFESESKLRKNLKDYEKRESQIDMMRAVINCFNNKFLSIIEAGTGIGKSLAYLLPALKWISLNKERVVVSTATINLQHQLVEKDIPLALKVLGEDIEYILLKGRNNYICRRKLDEEILSSDTLFNDDAENFDFLKEWVDSTTTGELDEITVPLDKNLRSRIYSESDLCIGPKCSHYAECFVMQVKKKALSAKLIVVNNHLLFSDLALNIDSMYDSYLGVIPKYNYLIFDEAHNIEKDATSHFTDHLNYKSIKNVASKIKFRKKKRVFGILAKLKNFDFIDAQIISDISLLADKMVAEAEALDDLSLALFSGNLNSGYLVNGALPEEILKPFKILAVKIEVLFNLVEQLLKKVVDNRASLKKEPLLEKEINSVSAKLFSMLLVSKKYFEISEHKDHIFWIKIEGDFKARTGKFVDFCITPINIAPLLNKYLWENKESIVFTSATLTIKKSFDFFKKSVGLDFSDRLDEQIFLSPFDYANRVVFSVPSDIPDVKFSEKEFENFSSDFTLKYLLKSNGRAMLLFTSFKMLENVYKTIAPDLKESGILVLKQGEDNRMRLLNKFKNDISSVLFATSSFWEGVDIPGESLEHLIIFKLPFNPPDDPIFKARCDIIDSKGGSSFFQLSIPYAVMRFKQGFGRVMRKKSDKGSVVLLDKRVLEKSYGKFFIDSVEKTKTGFASGSVIIEKVINYINSIE